MQLSHKGSRAETLLTGFSLSDSHRHACVCVIQHICHTSHSLVAYGGICAITLLISEKLLKMHRCLLDTTNQGQKTIAEDTAR
ncbi:hypothetical protein AV530_016827 [Patagioenas fasciata monilis]|uniref:Uncharacterized protein n=1 Tax=Patagioenas fasciata monilis TaxID=372326 RepID=A0A1V4J4W6_PATFA|nr:hypothetical protein AV530_016827 [Patagioenas fasciata monilis]